MAVLYRKYRPQTFAEILSQRPIVQTLKNQVAAGAPSHAYLFTGSRGVGKTSAARILAKAVNCLNSTQYTVDSIQRGDACGQCGVCKQIEAGNFMDLVEIDAASNTGVDNIRELIEHVKFAPSVGKYKVFIIDEVHMLSKGAFNALLKTLEEPPKHAIFVLATTEINKVPATIVSRTQRFDFKALDSNELLGHLEKICEKENIRFGKDILELVAQNAEGSVRDALSLLDKLLTLGEAAKLEDCQMLLGVTDLALCENLLSKISEAQAKDLPDFFSQISEKGLDFVIFNRDFLEYLRKALVFKVSEGAITGGLQKDHLLKLEQLTQQLPVPDLIFIIRLFLKSYKDLSVSPSPEIPMLLAGIEAAAKRAEGSGKKETLNHLQPVVQNHMPPAKVQTVIVEEEVKQTVAVSQTPEPQISLEEVESLWPKIIAQVKDINGPLSSMLRGARLQSVEGGRIVLGVKFLFDKQNLENIKNTSLVASIFEQLCGKKIGMSAQVIKSDNKGNDGVAEVLSDALKVFGGELVE